MSAFFIRINPLVIRLLRSRAHWPLSTKVGLLQYSGRKSGRRYETPVAWHRVGDAVVIALTERQGRNWWRNYRTPWPLSLQAGRNTIHGVAVALQPDSDAFAAWMNALLRVHPYLRPIFAVGGIRRDLTADELARLRQSSGLVVLASSDAELQRLLATPPV
ncbi:MAG: DUF385 domain-containing protein [Candidatus Dadabacteria bacterium]|nr:MAG: DUF385 domain-containing protein [Candidatus Dadabacteria bacterium]